ncbi:MAG: methyl-accepting chemotaxis protein, partial [Treponemataceae bacterium]
MTIRAKFSIFTLSIIVSVVALGLAGLWALNEVTALQKTASGGISAISELRRMDLLYKELLTTHNLDTTFQEWVRAFEDYASISKSFVEGPRIKTFLKDRDFKDTYDIAMRVMNANLQRVSELKLRFIEKKSRGELGDRGLMLQAFVDRREGAFLFQVEVSAAAAHFGETTGQITQQLVEAINKRTEEMQSYIITVFAAFILMMTIVISVVAYLFATRISAHIKLVERAVRLLSTGDVTHSLTIKSNDEFGLLSKNYNEFVGDFKNRLAAGLDFIRDMRETVTT